MIKLHTKAFCAVIYDMGPIIQTVMHCLIHPLSSKSIPLRLWVSDFMNQSTHKSSCYVPSSNTAFCTANRNRPTSLFSPVSSSSDQLQGYQKTYNHQQVFSQQQGTDRAHSRLHHQQINIICSVVGVHSSFSSVVFCPRMCVWRRKGGSTGQRWRLWTS